MALTKIPSHSSLADEQFITVQGPDQLTTGFSYDLQQRALYFKESQVIFPSFHGTTHIAEDPVPAATCDTPGLMSANDKCKLDAMLQMRLGVVGFQGGGFPDDGGWMHGDVILAAGTEFISLERIGNVIRFTVDSPIPLNCACEECNQIFWVQDETDVVAIRPPTCSGKLPGVNAYGEMKVYLFPESTIADPNNAANTLNNKGNYPTFVFKRYDDSIVPGAAELEAVLKRDPNNIAQTEIGWAFTPGATGIPECVWFTGKDNDGNQIRFDLNPESEPGLLGSLLFKGHLITKKMAVITDYTATILSTNQYSVRDWDVDAAEAVGGAYTATNVWQYANPENAKTGANPQSIILDSSTDLLPIGTLVDIWYFKVGEVAGEPINRHYFSKQPRFNPNHAWVWVDSIQFGDVAIAREELLPGAGSEDINAAVQVSAIRNLERKMWGITGFDDPLLAYDIAMVAGTDSANLNTEHKAIIDTTIPALKVIASDGTGDFSERPVWLWNRHNACNWLLRADIGRPSSSDFVPFDVVLRADIDEHDTKYMRVVGTGVINELNFVRVRGVHFHDLPSFGTIRVLTGDAQNQIFNYTRKFAYPYIVEEADYDSIVLASDPDTNYAFPGIVGDVVELLHQEYTSPVVRVEFSYDEDTELVEVQFKVGTLDMSLPYENDDANDFDDYVRGLAAGYTVSAVYSQAGTYTGVGTQPDSSPEGFIVYDGGAQVGGDEDEYWNRLEIMLRDGQIWIWWNHLLIPPSATLSAGLPTPVEITTPYFPITQTSTKSFGKVGFRMWPGATIRRMDVRTQLTLFNEFVYGQLEVS